MKKQCLAMILAVMMTLSGCGDSENKNRSSVQQFQIPSSQPESELSPIESLTGIDKKIYEAFINGSSGFYRPEEPRILEILGSDPSGKFLEIRVSGYLDEGIRYVGIRGELEGHMYKSRFYNGEIVDFDEDVNLGKINRAITQHWQDLGVI